MDTIENSSTWKKLVRPYGCPAGQTIQPDAGELELLLVKVLSPTSNAIDWDSARDALGKANGMPVTIGQHVDIASRLAASSVTATTSAVTTR